MLSNMMRRTLYNVIITKEGEVIESRIYRLKDSADLRVMEIVDEWTKNGAKVTPYAVYEGDTKEFMTFAYGKQYANKSGFYFENNGDELYGSVDIIETEIW